MPRYRMEHGKEFTLLAYTPEQWAAEIAKKFRALGCSVEYVAKLAAEIKAAKKIHS